MMVTSANQHEAWQWAPHFSPSEFTCSHCSQLRVHSDFMDKLFAIRAALALPMVITSGYRCPTHNRMVSSTGAQGPHTLGHAADIAASGEAVPKLIHLAQSQMTGIGLKQHGPHRGRFVHLDDLQGELRPRVWTYE